MKKSLTIISFAFIFLLTLSVVSAGLWITGDVQRSSTGDRSGLATSIKSADSKTTNTFSRTSGVSASARTNQAPECPRGWDIVKAKTEGNCCIKAENTGRAISRLLSRR